MIDRDFNFPIGQDALHVISKSFNVWIPTRQPINTFMELLSFSRSDDSFIFTMHSTCFQESQNHGIVTIANSLKKLGEGLHFFSETAGRPLVVLSLTLESLVFLTY